MLVSDYEWNVRKTHRDKWPGGFKRDGEPVTSLDGIKVVLEPHFELNVDPMDLKHSVKRSSRVTVNHRMQVTIWRKK